MSKKLYAYKVELVGQTTFSSSSSIFINKVEYFKDVDLEKFYLGSDTYYRIPEFDIEIKEVDNGRETNSR